MNWEQLDGNWMQLKGKIREQWGRLTHDDLDIIEGKEEQLVGAIQKRYGLAREEAEEQVRAWLDVAMETSDSDDSDDASPQHPDA